MGTFLDVDAPDTNWRAGSEDPIPFLLGRMPAGGFLYRFATCRPLDGHARTNATFLHPGTKALTKSGWTAPYNYLPGWKRGLLMTRLPAFGLLPYAAVAGVNEVLWDAGPWWMNWQGPALVWSPFVAGAGVWTTRYFINRQHTRHVIDPITAAAVNIVRSRDISLDLPRSLVNSEHSTETGFLRLPMSWSGSEGDRENLTEMLQEKTGSPVSLSFDMAGRSPGAKISIPKQPPSRLDWEDVVLRSNPLRPYLGESAFGSVFWDMGEDSPHIGIVGGSGSGKSELMAWIVAQFMRGGAKVVVMDPKGTSHAWLLRMSEVTYVTAGEELHDEIMDLSDIMDSRAEENRKSVQAGGADKVFPQIVVVLEERNSTQDKLRDYWLGNKPVGAPQLSPAIRALDRLSSMGRTLCITVLLAAQATAQVDIGKKNNYGSWAIAGRMQANHYKNIGVARKPAISAKPGRFAYVVAGEATVFQAAFPDLKNHTERLMEWARSGDPMYEPEVMMTQDDTVTIASSKLVSSEIDVGPIVTLRDYAEAHAAELSIIKLRNDRARKPGFPDPIKKVGKQDYYQVEKLDALYGFAAGEDEPPWDE